MLHGPKESLGSVTHRNEWWLPTKGWMLDKITLRDSARDTWVAPIYFGISHIWVVFTWSHLHLEQPPPTFESHSQCPVYLLE